MFKWCFGWEDLNFAKILPLVREKNHYANAKPISGKWFS